MAFWSVFLVDADPAAFIGHSIPIFCILDFLAYKPSVKGAVMQMYLYHAVYFNFSYCAITIYFLTLFKLLWDLWQKRHLNENQHTKDEMKSRCNIFLKCFMNEPALETFARGEEAGRFLFTKLSQTEAKYNAREQQIKLNNREQAIRRIICPKIQPISSNSTKRNWHSNQKKTTCIIPFFYRIYALAMFLRPRYKDRFAVDKVKFNTNVATWIQEESEKNINVCDAVMEARLQSCALCLFKCCGTSTQIAASNYRFSGERSFVGQEDLKGYELDGQRQDDNL
uniref:Uncharacterized protein n=1 Tax=Ditylenchus dipsaci TaxID=166011 RepID=A0A915D9Y8_9BILA